MLGMVKLPSTTVQPERSKQEMIEILKKFGINDYQWTHEKVRLVDFLRQRGQIPGLQLPYKPQTETNVLETEQSKVAD